VVEDPMEVAEDQLEEVVDDQAVDDQAVEGLQGALEAGQVVEDHLVALAAQEEGRQMVDDPLVGLEVNRAAGSLVVIVVHKAHEVHEALKAHEVPLAGEVPATVTDLTAEVQEDHQAGMEEDGITVMVPGDHLDGEVRDTILAMVPISHQAGHQAGSPFPTTWESQSRFRSQMAPGEILQTVQTSTPVLIATMVQTSFTIQAAMISAVTTIRTMSGTITKVAFMTTITPKAAATWTVSTMKMASGSTTTLAPSTKTTRNLRKTSAKKEKQTVFMFPLPLRTIEAIKPRLRTLLRSCQTRLS